MRSIRKTLVIGTTAGTAALLSAGGIVLFLLVRSGLVAQLDQSLNDNARLYASTVEQKRKKPGLEVDKLDMKEFEAPDRPEYLQLWGEDGASLFRSSSLGEADLEKFAAPIEAPDHRWVKLPSGHAARAVGMCFIPLPDRKAKDADAEPLVIPSQVVTLVLARDTRALDETLASLGTLITLVSLATLVATVAVLRVVIWRSLKPMDHLAAEIGRLDEEDLSGRVDLADAPHELQPVRDQLNGLLHRLEDAFFRERRLSADVAHELRTPLAGLRSAVEVALSRPRSPAESREVLADCLAIIRRMQDMVEKLLSLFHLEMGRLTIQTRDVSPHELIRNAWEALDGLAGARRLRVSWSLGVERTVVTDPDLLGLVIQNILENAVCHSDAGGTVSIAMVVDEDRLDLRVANSGCALDEGEAARVFDRFWRGDAVRSEAGVHCGLGLPLVRRVVEALGGSTRARIADGVFEIAVSVPAPAAPLAAPPRPAPPARLPQPR
jgi:signal transduction histidine kinase